MPLGRVPLFEPVNQNVDEMSLNGPSSELFNGYLDEIGAIRKRAGLLQFADLGTGQPVDGLYWWNERELLIAVSGANIYKVDSSGNVTLIGAGLNVGRRPTFAASKPAGVHTLSVANGNNMYTTNGTALTLVSDPDSPQHVTHLAFLDQYIIANDVNTADVQFSAIADPTSWNALDFFAAEALPDDVVCLDTGFEEILVLGTRSGEFFYNDGSTPFARIDGTSFDNGCIAQYSLRKLGTTWIWLDNYRQFIMMQGRTPTVISGAIAKTLRNFTTVDDAIADVINFDGRYFYVCTFPTENRTLVYDYVNNRWMEWGEWDENQDRYFRWGGSCHAYAHQLNRNYVGSRSDDKIYRMDESYLDDSGTAIRLKILSGYYDHGTHFQKRSNALMLRLKRGTEDAGREAKFMVRWRNENQQEFLQERTILMGATGQTDFFVQLRSNGVFRSRQYEFVVSDDVPVTVVQAEEDFTVLTK